MKCVALKFMDLALKKITVLLFINALTKQSNYKKVF